MDLLKLLFTSKKKKRLNVAFCGVVVDMMQYYLSHHDKEKAEEMIGSQLKVIDFLNQMNYPIAVLEYDERGTTIDRVAEEVEKNKRHAYFLKQCNDGFLDTNLFDKLRKWQSNHLIMMGINASYCVFETAQSGSQYGFQISTAKDLIRDMDSKDGIDLWRDPLQKKVRKWYKRECKFYTDTAEDLIDKINRGLR